MQYTVTAHDWTIAYQGTDRDAAITAMAQYPINDTDVVVIGDNGVDTDARHAVFADVVDARCALLAG